MKQLEKMPHFFFLKFGPLPLPGRLYFRFSLVALGIMILALIILDGPGRNVYQIGIETMLLFSIIYFFLLVIMILGVSSYKRETNLIAGIIPALMTLGGIITATYLQGLWVIPNHRVTLVIYPILVTLILPAGAAFFDRPTGIKMEKLYFFSAAQIVLAGLLTLWFLSGL